VAAGLLDIENENGIPDPGLEAPEWKEASVIAFFVPGRARIKHGGDRYPASRRNRTPHGPLEFFMEVIPCVCRAEKVRMDFVRPLPIDELRQTLHILSPVEF